MEDQPTDDQDAGELSYELDEWAVESRELLDRLLTSNGVTHTWQGGRLDVSADDGALVDELIEDVEATVAPVLDPEAEKVVYEVAEWSPEDRADLTDALIEEGVRHVFDEMGDLLVEAIEEERVDEIVDRLTDGEEDEGDDGPVANEVLSALFVAADKLRRSPRDGRTIAELREQAAMVVAMNAPYGIERRTWAQVGLRSGALRVLLEQDSPDDDDVVDAAAELRELLHPLI
jgi:hypothetical protein